MSPVRYREAGQADVPAIAAIRTDWGEWMERQRDRMARYLAGEHHPRQALIPRVMYVALEGDRPVGYVAGHLTRRYACDGELQWIYVAPEHRGSGVAAELLCLLAAWFAGRGASRVCVDVDPANTPARRFYRRHGAGDLNPYWLVWEDIGVVLRHDRPGAPANASGSVDGRIRAPDGRRERTIDRQPEDSAMSATETAQAPAVVFGGCTPILRVRDLPASIDHYVRVLGFRVDWEDPGVIASVSRGGTGVFLCQGDQGNPGSWVWVGVNDAGALFEEYRATGARIRHPPTNYAWALEMQVEDPDGNVLRCGSDPRTDEPVGEWLDMRGRRWAMSPAGEWAVVPDGREPAR